MKNMYAQSNHMSRDIKYCKLVPKHPRLTRKLRKRDCQKGAEEIMSRNSIAAQAATSPVEELQLRNLHSFLLDPKTDEHNDGQVNNLVQELDQPLSAESAEAQRLSLERRLRLLRPERFV